MYVSMFTGACVYISDICRAGLSHFYLPWKKQLLFIPPLPSTHPRPTPKQSSSFELKEYRKFRKEDGLIR